jgi:type IV pilus assembly protein PilA
MLARLRKSVEDKDQGFTLIELLVVIIIIGILAAIAIPVFLSQRQKGWDAAVKSDLRNAATAQETFLTENSLYSTETPVDGALTGELGAKGFKYSDGGNYVNDTAAITATAVAGDSYCLSATSKSGTDFAYDSSAGGFVASC